MMEVDDPLPHSVSEAKVESLGSPDTPGPKFGGELALSAILLLMLTNALSMADRQIVGILAEPIKHELGMSDKQLGMLIGLSFAVFYTSFGLIIARLLDRKNRVRVMAICLAGWSVCTALCGLARSFGVLLAMRVGVAMGEASCFPGAQSMIADYVPMHRRAFAMSILVAGSSLGTLFGMSLGGIISYQFGWRAAFLAAGLPGLFLAFVLWFAIRDPKRDVGAQASANYVNFGQAFGVLRRTPTYWLITIGSGCNAFTIYANTAFLAAFYLRAHAGEVSYYAGGMGPTGLVGIMLGLVLGLAGVFGTLTGGRLADIICKGDLRKFMVLSMIAALVSIPFFVASMLAQSFVLSAVLLVPATFISFFTPGISYTAAVSVVPSPIRATAAAMTLFVVNLIGLGLGPVCTGTLSDFFARSLGSAEGLRYALVASCGASFATAFFYWLARRHLLGTPDPSTH